MLIGLNSLDTTLVSVTFVPLAVGALRVCDERSLRWLKRFSGVCAVAIGEVIGTTFATLMHKLSGSLWRGNSRMLRVVVV